jgi:hypothetical protein
MVFWKLYSHAKFAILAFNSYKQIRMIYNIIIYVYIYYIYIYIIYIIYVPLTVKSGLEW